MAKCLYTLAKGQSRLRDSGEIKSEISLALALSSPAWPQRAPLSGGNCGFDRQRWVFAGRSTAPAYAFISLDTVAPLMHLLLV